MTRVAVYVDDEAAICRVVELRLRAAGVPIVTFTDPEAAIAYIARNEVAAVLCDFRMPAMSGLELLDRIEKEVPFYIVTGDITVDADVAARARIADLIPKPIPFERVVALLRSLDEPGMQEI